ncbi:guanine nucleotide exchange factor [Flammula alnicola]|nr:guanine nucleotide exchange factor [Flammula alnicola]
MSDILKAYTAISPSSSRTDVADVLKSIINSTAPPFAFDKTSRIELIKAIIHDLKNYGSKGKLTSKDAAQALLAVKTLGKDPTGSRSLASSTNLTTLLGFATTFKDDPEAASEALRCIANALLLVEEARSTFISKEINGGDVCALMLEKTTSADHIFILSRILFLSTASGPTYIETMVDGKHHGRTIVDILGSKLDLMTSAIRNGTPIAKEAMTDVLKFTFNILLHYPKLTESEPQNSDSHGHDKVMGDFWSSKLDPVLPPLLRVFRDLPPTSPAPITAPLTHVIHSLITIPISPALKPIWLGQATSTSRNSSSNSPKTKTPQQLDSSPASRSDSPTRLEKSPTSPKSSTIDRALSVLAAAGRSLSRTSSPTIVVEIDVLQRAYDLLELSFSHYFPGDVNPDAPEIRQRQKAESPLESLDDVLSPLVVLISRLCVADEGCRARVRQWLIPDDLDRSSSLEQRSDMLGKCLRFLGCVYHPRLKDAVGEMLYALSDSDASMLCALVGYGNVAGFLFHKGIMNAPPPPSNTSSNIPAGAQELDPITGLTAQPKPDLPEMTDEEKQREMEKLFVLFDRLEKTGALPPDQIQ